MEHNAAAPADALTAFHEVRDLLSAHPDFKVVPAKVPSRPRRTSLLGLAIRNFRLRKFGARFGGGLTLLHFQPRWEAPGMLIVDLHWHVTRIGEGLWVFIHFLDAADEICFQGDYPLECEAQDALGFLYSRRRVDVPKAVPPGTYGVRLGVWRPAEGKHVKLLSSRGCQRETATWCRDAVVLTSIEKRTSEGE